MAAYYEMFTQRLESLLQEKNKATDVVKVASQKTGVPQIHIAQGILGFIALYMIIGHFAELICNIVGFAYPAYCSIYALESPETRDDKKWLTYWVVYAFFSTVEFFSDIIFSFFPFYWLFKVGFLIWCFLPLENNGSIVIYNRFIRPVFLRNQTKIDQAGNQVTDLLNRGLDAAQKFANKTE